ncbi:DUF1670 domain-containing protein [Chloroflexi bacterium TSY]|nr:DUF1670 domain-containing protein [Chloroflexi bacterium TSY]
MSKQAYVGSQKRTFEAAFIHTMEQNYGFLKSKRMLQLLAQDVLELVRQFFPKPDYLEPGWILFTGTKAQGGKAFPGQDAAELPSATIPWPLLTSDDLEWRATRPDTNQERYKLLIRRTVRLIQHGQNHPRGPVLLTVADLALLLGLTTVQVSQLLTDARQQTGKPLHTKGYYFDQGLRPSHKAEIIHLFEQGHDEADIARLSQHAQSSVGRYLRDYDRVKVLCKMNVPVEQFPRLLGMQPSVVDSYVELLRRYRPHLFDSNHSESSLR